MTMDQAMRAPKTTIASRNIVGALGDLRVARNDLNDQIAVLGDALGPILAPPGPSAISEVGDTAMAESQVMAEIDEATRHIRRMVGDIHELVERSQV
jgi:hypothetical protein